MAAVLPGKKRRLGEGQCHDVEITAVRSNLLKEHTRSLEGLTSAVKRLEENTKALKEEIDELCREKTSKNVGGD